MGKSFRDGIFNEELVKECPSVPFLHNFLISLMIERYSTSTRDHFSELYTTTDFSIDSLTIFASNEYQMAISSRQRPPSHTYVS